jgi:malate synthase
MERIEIAGLKIATELRDFVEQEALPCTGVSADTRRS